MIVRAALFALSSALLVACASQTATEHVERPGSADRQALTIFVPARQTPLATRIRALLSAHGWQPVAYTAGAGISSADAQAMSIQGRYRLTLDARPAGKCRNDGPGYAYQLSIIENRTGTVPLTLSGADCLDAIVSQFQQTMVADGLLR
ncbi:MAG: hypothetical protein PF501_14425 [Salinisphaera sp.]|jgi:hypothetical protein|nr:hypothetical protein [Salinisphaera sp.]